MEELVMAPPCWRPGRGRAVPTGAALAGMLVCLAPSVAGQTQPLTISVNDYRPMRAAVVQIRKLSGIAVNYEDVRCDYPGDQLDETAGSFTPAEIQMSIQSGRGSPRLIVPRGGPLSFSVSVDAATGQLADLASTEAAVRAALAAYNSSGLPGKFGLEVYGGELIVAPVGERDVNGATVPAASILSTPVTLPSFEESAMERAGRILQAVTQGTGYKVGIGTVPINGMAMMRVGLGGSTEPAGHLLIRLLNAVMGYASSLPSGDPALAYDVLYDVQLKYYMFNAAEVGRRGTALPPAPHATPTGIGRPGIRLPNR
jgi:hypothetical protein